MANVRRVGILAVAIAGLATASVLAQNAEAPKEPADAMAAAFERVKKFIEPGAQHKQLDRFLGDWEMETRFVMGGQSGPGEKGELKCTWLIDGRWIKLETSGKFMGRDYQGFMILGYDNFKMSYVTTSVSNMDTAMTHSEGDMDPGGDALLTYGTLDEYMTGEHDKMVKYVWRFPSSDKVVLEVHDLPIGEKNTKVVEFTFTKKP
ncbi:MAG: DUF1579 family protein [Phycisphaerales bacterium]|nr:DUF1579 family protein [Phycisphaerales bacterium]